MILYFGEMQSLNSLKTLIIVTGVSVSLPVDRSISSKTEVFKLTKNASRHDQEVEFCFAIMNHILSENYNATSQEPPNLKNII